MNAREKQALLSTLPGRPFEARSDTAVLTLPLADLYKLPSQVQDALQAYCLRQYSDVRTAWIEVSDYRKAELLAMMKRIEP